MIAKVIAVCAALVAITSAHASLPQSYSAGPTYATVIDRSTGKPVEGAAVVAQWVLEGGMHVDRVGVLMVKEAITDAQGKFRIDGWGPVPRPSRGVLDGLDPELVIFKSGGQLGGASNNTGGGIPRKRVHLEQRDSIWNGRVIKITAEEDEEFGVGRSSRVFAVEALLDGVLRARDCKWTEIPRAIATLEKELNRVGQASVSITGKRYLARTDCGSLSEFSKAYEEMSKGRGSW